MSGCPPSPLGPAAEGVTVRLHGDPGVPVLIYLPGLHGDDTLARSFCAVISRQVRFVEVIYPRTVTWSLAEHAQAIRRALIERGIRRGWLLGESFGSQIVWALLAGNGDDFQVDGVILAGGFVRHPLPGVVRLARWCSTRWPRWFVRAALRLYGLYAGFRHRRAPETRQSVAEFIARRLDPLDRPAICNRLGLIASSDWRAVAVRTQVPVYALAGGIDPIVPVAPVWRWLRRNCPGYRGERLIWWADHNVLGTAPAEAAEQVLRWMNAASSSSRRVNRPGNQDGAEGKLTRSAQ